MCEGFKMQFELKVHHVLSLGGAELTTGEHTGILSLMFSHARSSLKALMY